MAYKIVTPLMLLASMAAFQAMWPGDEWVRWSVVGGLVLLLAGSLVDAWLFLRHARRLRASGWNLTLLDRAFSLGSVASWKLARIPARDECIARPGYDAQQPDIANIMKLLRERPKGE